MDEKQHEDDHHWIGERRQQERRWEDRKEATIKAIVIWAVVSFFTGIGSIFAYALHKWLGK
jgi:hypothetical protein